MCYYDEFGTKRVKSCKDDTDILDAYIEYYCSNMACGDNSRYCAPTCTGCGTKLEFCGQGITMVTKIIVGLLKFININLLKHFFIVKSYNQLQIRIQRTCSRF